MSHIKPYSLSSQKFLSPSEHDSLMALVSRYNGSRDAIMIELLISTGARIGELLMLTPLDLSHENESVLIKGLKGSSDREIPLRFELWKKLINLAHDKPIDQPIFNICVRQAERIWHQWRPCKKKLHSLRHTFAIRLFEKHRDIRLVQIALGHRSITNTMIYAEYHYKTQELRKLLVG